MRLWFVLLSIALTSAFWVAIYERGYRRFMRRLRELDRQAAAVQAEQQMLLTMLGAKAGKPDPKAGGGQ